MAMMIKSNTLPFISQTISDAIISHVKNLAMTKEDATAMGIWDKIKDWFCGTKKEVALGHIYDLTHQGNLSKPQFALQCIKAFHSLSTMVGAAHQDKFTALITENPQGGWDLEFIIEGALRVECSLDPEQNENSALSLVINNDLMKPNARQKTLENNDKPLNTQQEGRETSETNNREKHCDNALFFAHLHTFLNEINIPHLDAALHQPAMARLAALKNFDVMPINPRASLMKITNLISEKTPDDNILVLKKEVTSNLHFSFDNENKVKQSARLTKYAADAASYLRSLPEFKNYFSKHPSGKLPSDHFTAGDLKPLKESYLEELKGIYKVAPLSVFKHDEVFKTPSEVAFLWMYILRDAAVDLKNESAHLMTNLFKTWQSRYLNHKALTLSTTRSLLKEDANLLRRAGLNALANVVDAKEQGVVPCLLKQLPTADSDLSPTRLHDNVYGRVFESNWIASLVANPPDEVKSAMSTIAHYYSTYLSTLSCNKQDKMLRKVLMGLHRQIVADNRHWFKAFPEIKALSTSTFELPSFLRELQKILCSDINTGEQCIAVPYLAVKLFNAINGLPVTKQELWQIWTNVNYKWYIQPRTGRTVENKTIAESNVIPIPTAGITLRYQPPAVSNADRMTPEVRPCNRYHIPSAENINSFPAVKNALEHSLPYSGGVSGSTGIMLSIINHLKNQGTNIDLRMGLLGSIMFMNYDGGHSIHESLWVANQKGINLSKTKACNKNLDGFISDYESFVALYKNTQCEEALDEALSIAWERSFDYLAQYSDDYKALKLSNSVQKAAMASNY